MLSGTKPLDEAYKEVRKRQLDAENDEAKKAGLATGAPPPYQVECGASAQGGGPRPGQRTGSIRSRIRSRSHPGLWHLTQDPELSPFLETARVSIEIASLDRY